MGGAKFGGPTACLTYVVRKCDDFISGCLWGGGGGKLPPSPPPPPLYALVLTKLSGSLVVLGKAEMDIPADTARVVSLKADMSCLTKSARFMACVSFTLIKVVSSGVGWRREQ